MAKLRSSLDSELSALSMAELKAYRQLFIRYFGQYSDEVSSISREIKRRKSIKPTLHIVMESMRYKVRQLSKEIQRLDAMRFDTKHTLYDPITLDVFEPKSIYDPDTILTGRLAYRIACERIEELGNAIIVIEHNIQVLHKAVQLNAMTLDVLDAYEIVPGDYSLELKKRLQLLQHKTLPGTSKPKPSLFRRYIPQPEHVLNPGDYLFCKHTKNFRSGKYKIVFGGVGYNRYYCRKLLEVLEPEDDHLLFVASYIGGYGHYVISVPIECCFEKALGYIFTKAAGCDGYYEKLRATYNFAG